MGRTEEEEGNKGTLMIVWCRRSATSQFTQEEIGDDLITLQNLKFITTQQNYSVLQCDHATKNKTIRSKPVYSHCGK